MQKQIRLFGLIFQNSGELQNIRQRTKAAGCKSIKSIYVSAVLTYAVRVAFRQNLKGSQCARRSSSMPRQPAHRNRDPLLLNQSRHQTSASTNRQRGDRKLERGNSQWGMGRQPAQQRFSQCAPKSGGCPSFRGQLRVEARGVWGEGPAQNSFRSSDWPRFSSPGGEGARVNTSTRREGRGRESRRKGTFRGVETDLKIHQSSLSLN